MLRFVLLFFLFPLAAQAALDIGAGFNSTTSGRLVPAIVGGLSGSGWALTGSATGVKSNYYYQSSYTMNYYWTWRSGDILSGEVISGFGLGGLLSKRGFQDEGSTELRTTDDSAFGPAFHVKWLFAKYVYLNVEVLWGLHNLAAHLTLNGKDVVTFSLGVTTW